MAVGFRPLIGGPGNDFGAEVVGVPPNLRMDEAEFRAIELAWYRHSILLFRGLDMQPEDQIAFTRWFGPLHIMVPPEHNLPGHPEIFAVGNAVKEDGTPLGLRRAGMGFSHRRRGQAAAECRFVALRPASAAIGRRHDFRRHVCRVRGTAACSSSQDRRQAGAVQPGGPARCQLSAPADAPGTARPAGCLSPA